MHRKTEKFFVEEEKSFITVNCALTYSTDVNSRSNRNPEDVLNAETYNWGLLSKRLDRHSSAKTLISFVFRLINLSRTKSSLLTMEIFFTRWNGNRALKNREIKKKLLPTNIFNVLKFISFLQSYPIITRPTCNQ